MQKSRIILTKQELDFASSTLYPDTKHAVIAQLTDLFHELGEQLSRDNLFLPGKDWKISKGENYQRMPYLVLDYPRINQGSIDVLGRTLFWWGHYFSTNLIIRKSLLSDEVVHLNDKVYQLREGDIWNNDIQQGYELSESVDHSLVNDAYIRITRTLPVQQFSKLSELILSYGKDWQLMKQK